MTDNEEHLEECVVAYVKFVLNGCDPSLLTVTELRLAREHAINEIVDFQKLTANGDVSVSVRASFDRLSSCAADNLAIIQRHLAAKSIATHEAIKGDGGGIVIATTLQ